MVEFALALIPFLLILMGIVDLGRGIYMSSGVSQAAREIARATAVHVCGSPCTIGNSAETQAVIATQKNLVPGLASPSSTIVFECTDVVDATATTTDCTVGSNSPRYIRVTVSVPFSALTPVLSMVAPSTLVSSAHVALP